MELWPWLRVGVSKHFPLASTCMRNDASLASRSLACQLFPALVLKMGKLWPRRVGVIGASIGPNKLPSLNPPYWVLLYAHAMLFVRSITSLASVLQS